jgi:hypothetical protein
MSKKTTVISILILAAILLVSVGGYFGYKSYKLSRYDRFATRAIESGDVRTAHFWLTQILSIEPHHVSALQELTSNPLFYRNPELLNWWKAYSEALPEDTLVQFGYIETLIRLGRLDQAKEKLEALSPAPEFAARFANLKAAYAIAVGDFENAKAQTRESIKQSPETAALKINLLRILLLEGNPESETEINDLISDLMLDIDNEVEVWRVLFGYSAGRNRWGEAIKIGEKLANHPEVEWYEITAYLKLLIQFEPEKVEPYVLSLTDPEPLLIEEFSRILNGKGYSEVLLNWMHQVYADGMEPTLSSQICESDTLAALQRWDELLAFTEPLNWEYFDYYRLALQARALDHLGKEIEASELWNEAVKKARTVGLQEEIRIATVVESWPRFEPKWIALLENMLNNSVHTQWAHNKLQSFYYQTGATHELYRIARRALQHLPNAPEIQNNAIILALLLDRDIPQQVEKAKAQYESYPGKPIPTSTYAFALYKNGQTEEASKVLSEIDDRHFEIAELAHYASIIEQAAGNTDRAAELHDKAASAHLLPEELALWKKAAP